MKKIIMHFPFFLYHCCPKPACSPFENDAEALRLYAIVDNQLKANPALLERAGLNV